jgi:hypothetical protein
MTATHNTNGTVSSAPVLYLALDLGASSWKLAFSVGLGQKHDHRIGVGLAAVPAGERTEPMVHEEVWPR